jgi:hypothetical protein
VTAAEIQSLYDSCNGIPCDISGFEDLEPHAMEHLYNCFEHRGNVNRNWTGARKTMLVQAASWRVEVAPIAFAICQAEECGVTIDDGLLRFGMMPTEPKGAELCHKWRHW